MTDAHTHRVALLGWPLSHTRSPLIHNTAFEAQGLNWVYLATPVAPGDLEAAVRGLAALRFEGANVTIPHKQSVRRLMDTLSDEAEAVGAVNTVVVRWQGERARFHGDNTDVAGFLDGLGAHANAVRGEEAIVFGAGGAARAVVYALLQATRPRRLTIVARRAEQAEALADSFAPYDSGGALAVALPGEASAAVRSSRLLVNATPLGMHPHLDASPWTAAGDFQPGQIIYDLVYNPERTRLLREAAARGATPVGGLEMLIRQAAASYRQWTGQEMPLDAVRQALRTA